MGCRLLVRMREKLRAYSHRGIEAAEAKRSLLMSAAGLSLAQRSALRCVRALEACFCCKPTRVVVWN